MRRRTTQSNREYTILIRGPTPGNLAERIADLHAFAVLGNCRRLGRMKSVAEGDSEATCPQPDSGRLKVVD